MRFFSKGPLKRRQLRQIKSDAGCSEKSAIARANAAVKGGMQIDRFMDGKLYMMTPKQLARYLKNPSPRRYVEAFRIDDGSRTDYEIYSQMKRAREEFGISYSAFSNRKLLDATDGELEKAHKDIERKNDRAISRIARSLGVSEEEARKIADRIKSRFGYSYKAIYQMRLYVKSDEEIAEQAKKVKARKKENIEKVQKATGWSKSEVLAHMNHCATDFAIESDLYMCLRCFEMDDWQLALCGNTRDSMKLTTKYNTKNAHYFKEKELLYCVLGDFLNRRFWVNRNTSFDEFLEFSNGLSTVFCKPSDSLAGKGAYKYDLEGKDPKEVYDFFMGQSKYIIEECVEQHPDMAEFYPDSINTVRLITILENGEFDVFLSVARFGVDGVIDNFTAGGIACAVDPDTGRIMTNGCNKYAEVFERHPVTGTVFKGFQIPYWDEVLEMAEAALRTIDGVDFAGWDFAIREDGPVIIEGNAGSGFKAPQTTWYSEGVLIRDKYYKYLDTNVYDDMLNKVVENMKAFGLSEEEATNRLIEAQKLGLDYEVVMQEGLCEMPVEQIREYVEMRQTDG